MDLSGPHEPSPQPGRKVGSALAHYFLVLSVRFAPAGKAKEGVGEAKDTDEADKVGDPAEDLQRPILYAALLEKKGDAPKAIMGLLAQIRSEHGGFPQGLVFRLHSDKGLEFINEELDDYLKFHGIHHTTTQGYDPSSNGTAESAVGLLKARGRYLLFLQRLPTRWWGVAVLAAAQLYRADAHVEAYPAIPFGTRIMCNVDPKPRNAFMPRSLPGTLFGPCDTIPGGYWIYQGCHVKTKVNVQAAGFSEEELRCVKASMDD